MIKKTKPNNEIGKFKAIKMWQADIDCSDTTREYIIQVGKAQCTDNQYFEIGAVHIITEAVTLTKALASKSATKPVASNKNKRK